MAVDADVWFDARGDEVVRYITQSLYMYMYVKM